LICPSNGWRLFPGYPYDPKKEKPHRDRALENNIYIVRTYCAGWMFPLYFQGHTEIVDNNGIAISSAKTNNKTELVIADISMEDEQLLPINQD
jgi:predicted amidohydrolase